MLGAEIGSTVQK